MINVEIVAGRIMAKGSKALTRENRKPDKDTMNTSKKITYVLSNWLSLMLQRCEVSDIFVLVKVTDI